MTYLQPALLCFFLLAAIGVVAHRSRWGRRAGIAGPVFLFLWCWPPMAWLAAGTLEWFYPVQTLPSGDAQAPVVLGGGVYPPNASYPEATVAWDSYMRAHHTAWLYHHWRQLPVVVSGGPGQRNVLTARVLRAALESEGVPAAAILNAEKSHLTYENALYTAQLLLPRGITRIALVTEAQHMLRSEQSFRKQGFTVIPAPCAFRTLEFRWDGGHLLPGDKPIRQNSDALHEWVGLLWYKLTGRV